jgi:multidrug resistance protein MdtO
MAPLADDGSGGVLRARWLEVVTDAPGRGEFALRLALICALVTWITQIYQTPEPALAAYVVFFMNQPDRVSSIRAGVGFAVLTSLVIGLLLLLANETLDVPALRVTVMVALSLGMLFLASASRLKPFAGIFMLVVAYALDQLARVPTGELATRGLLYAWLLVGIPAGATVAINLLIGLAPAKLATQAIALRLRAAQGLLASPGESARGRVLALRRGGEAGIQGNLHLAGLEKTAPREDLQAFGQSARSIGTLLMLVDALDQAHAPPDWQQAAATRLGEMAAIFERGRYPVDIEPVPCVSLLPDGAIARLVTDFNDTLAHFAQPRETEATPAAEVKRGFFDADAFTNPAHVRFAVKVTAAAMTCYLFYSLTHWPGIHTCLITCYIVGLGTAAETVEKMALRVAGALLGAAAGLASIVWLVPSIDHVAGLLELVFAGGLAGGWIAAGSPRIAYAGFQLAFAFFLCVIQGSGPGYDLAVARDRIVGILLGNVVVYVIFAHVWPVSIAPRIDAAIAVILRELVAIARMDEHGRRRGALPAVQAQVAAVAADLHLARYEPLPLRPSADWLRLRQTWIAAAAASEFPLLLGDARAGPGAIAMHLQRLADAVDGDTAKAGRPVGEQGSGREQPLVP